MHEKVKKEQRYCTGDENKQRKHLVTKWRQPLSLSKDM
jgi:hypothetical protein